MRLPRAPVLGSLVLVPLGASLLAPGCGSTPEGPDAAVDDAGAGDLRPPPFTRTETEAELATKRAACTFKAGAWHAQRYGRPPPEFEPKALERLRRQNVRRNSVGQSTRGVVASSAPPCRRSQ